MPPPSQPDRELTAQEKLAATVEDLFSRYQKTLADADTAEDYLITLGAVRKLLEGARVRGVVGEDVHRDLDAMIEGLMAVPGLLA